MSYGSHERKRIAHVEQAIGLVGSLAGVHGYVAQIPCIDSNKLQSIPQIAPSTLVNSFFLYLLVVAPQGLVISIQACTSSCFDDGSEDRKAGLCSCTL